MSHQQQSIDRMMLTGAALILVGCSVSFCLAWWLISLLGLCS